MARLWQEHVHKGWQAVALQPGQERSDKLNLEGDTFSIKKEVYDPRTGLQYEGRRPKCHVEDGRLVLDEPIGRACLFLVRPRTGSSASEPEDEPEPEDEES